MSIVPYVWAGGQKCPGLVKLHPLLLELTEVAIVVVYCLRLLSIQLTEVVVVVYCLRLLSIELTEVAVVVILS